MRPTVFACVIALIVATNGVITGTPSVEAVVLTVTKTADTNDGACDSDCSLREAVIAANTIVGPDSISLPPGTYALTIWGRAENAAATGDLDFTDETTLTGAGADTTTIDGSGYDRVLDVFSTVHISAVTIQNGRGDVEDSTLGLSMGGGIKNVGILTVENCNLSNNYVYGGDGFGFGGAIANWQGGECTLLNSTVANNQVDNGFGDAIFSGPLGLIGAGPMVINNSTISGNHHPGSAVTSAAIEGGPLNIANTTIVGNSAPGVSSGATLENVIIASNGDQNCSGPVISLGHNLDDDGSCNLTGPGDLSDVADPRVGALANNGGPTQTRALLPGSPALDAGSPTSCPSTDQRGVIRPQGPACDIGAFEAMAAAQLDHYLCRQVKDLKTPAKFVAQSGIGVVDQTQGDLCDLKKPFLLCDPASKNGGPVNDPTAHLCCYKAKCQQTPEIHYQITDQFGTLTISTKKPKFLCNPCIKNPA